MSKDELMQLIHTLETQLDLLPALQRATRRNQLTQLKNNLEAMALDDIANIMSSVSLPEKNEINSLLDEASNANTSHTRRVESFNIVYNFIKNRLI